MPFAAALSFHPVTAHATGEAVGQVIDRFGTHPDLVAIVVSPGHAGALEDAAAAVRSLLAPTVLLGWVSTDVTNQVIVDGPAPGSAARSVLGLWAATTGPVAPVRWPDTAAPPVGRGLGVPFDLRGAVVLAAPTGGRPTGPLLGLPPGVPIAGAVGDVGGSPIVLDDALFADGAVGVALGPGVDLSYVIEEGRRPIGTPVTVTETVGPLLIGLADRPAMTVLTDIARDQVPAGDIALINRSVHLAVTPRSGAAPAEHAIRGRDAATGALVTDPPVEPGDMIQFCVRDPRQAQARACEAITGSGGGALLWQSGTAPGRGNGRSDGPDASAPVLGCRAATLYGRTGSEGGTDPAAIGVGLFLDVSPG